MGAEKIHSEERQGNKDTIKSTSPVVSRRGNGSCIREFIGAIDYKLLSQRFIISCPVQVSCWLQILFGPLGCGRSVRRLPSHQAALPMPHRGLTINQNRRRLMRTHCATDP